MYTFYNNLQKLASLSKKFVYFLTNLHAPSNKCICFYKFLLKETVFNNNKKKFFFEHQKLKFNIKNKIGIPRNNTAFQKKEQIINCITF